MLICVWVIALNRCRFTWPCGLYSHLKIWYAIGLAHDRQTTQFAIHHSRQSCVTHIRSLLDSVNDQRAIKDCLITVLVLIDSLPIKNIYIATIVHSLNITVYSLCFNNNKSSSRFLCVNLATSQFNSILITFHQPII